MFSAPIKTELIESAEVNLPFGKFYDALIDWRIVLTICAVYLIVVQTYNSFILKAIKKSKNKTDSQKVTGKSASISFRTSISESKPFKAIVLIHNISLSLFSAKVFVSVISNTFHCLSNHALADSYCDLKGHVWNGFLFYWAWVFYLSKYYEFVDTLILMFKGKNITTLQCYHHAGAVVSMWLIIIAKAAGSWAFVMFNSFVHSIMYFYYAATTLGIKPPYKSLLTTLQIFQFALGVPVSISYIIVPGCMRKIPGKIAVELSAYSFVALYLVPLMQMFINFARNTFYPAKPIKSSVASVISHPIDQTQKTAIASNDATIAASFSAKKKEN